jgi:(p)ppGpp synthase/HD superfamily hydrolase
MKTNENRASFFARLPHISKENRYRLELAYFMSKNGHRWETRKERDDDGKPLRYFEHPRRVALMLIDDFNIDNVDYIISALLHDGLENIRDLTDGAVEYYWGSEPARIIGLLSKIPKEGYIDRLHKFADWPVLLIKACDRSDNLGSMEEATPEFIVKQVNETRNIYYPLFNKMVEIAPTMHQEASRRLRDRIVEQTETQAKRLAL